MRDDEGGEAPPAGDGAETCPICLEALDGAGGACRTDCGHAFHSRCILQSVQRTQGCPICRTPLCTPPAAEPAAPGAALARVSVRAIALGAEPEEDDAEATRRQRAYDARRRRLERRVPEVGAAKERADACYRQFVEAHTDYERAWDEGIRELERAPPVHSAKRARRLAMRRMRDARRRYRALVHAELGERPVTQREVRQETLAMAIERLMRARV